MLKALKLSILVAAFGGVAAIASAQGPQWGGSDDVPTWQPGEIWPMRRTFTIEVNTVISATDTILVDLAASLAFEDLFTLQVDSTTPIIDAAPSIGSYTEKAYLRKRTAGAITVNGTAVIKLLKADRTPYFAGEEVHLTLTLPSSSSMGAGSENWIGVSDLSQIRERFVTPNSSGTMVAHGFTNGVQHDDNLTCSLLPALGVTCGNTAYTFILGVDLAIDHYSKQDGNTTSGLELVDFPTIDPFIQTPDTFPGGEMTSVLGQRAITGNLHLEAPALSLNTNVALNDIATGVNYLLQFEAKGLTEPQNHVYSDNRKFVGLTAPNDDTIYYSPTLKDFSYWKLGNLTVNASDLTVTLRNFTTFIRAIGPTLKPDGNITNLVIDPARPSFGQPFEVRGFAGSTTGTLVTATLLRPLGLSDVQTTQTTAGGAFAVRMTAPLQGDNSPSIPGSHEAEYGSFGIELVRAGSTTPYNRKVVTVRLDAPLAAKEWNRYE